MRRGAFNLGRPALANRPVIPVNLVIAAGLAPNAGTLPVNEGTRLGGPVRSPTVQIDLDPPSHKKLQPRSPRLAACSRTCPISGAISSLEVPPDPDCGPWARNLQLVWIRPQRAVQCRTKMPAQTPIKPLPEVAGRPVQPTSWSVPEFGGVPVQRVSESPFTLATG